VCQEARNKEKGRMNMETEVKIKECIPFDVKIQVDGIMHTGRVSGRKLDFPMVWTPAGTFEFSWAAVTRGYNGATLKANQ